MNFGVLSRENEKLRPVYNCGHFYGRVFEVGSTFMYTAVVELSPAITFKFRKKYYIKDLFTALSNCAHRWFEHAVKWFQRLGGTG
jgi:hypothetical protein